MHFKLILTESARRDIQDAIDWENGRSQGLGKRFFEKVEIAFNAIIQNPLSGTIRFELVRCRRTTVFRYLIYYTCDESTQTVTVLRVLHTSRKPL